MFKFDFFKNANKPESITTNTSEDTSEGVDQLVVESLNTPEISYKSPEYEDALSLYKTNKEDVVFSLQNYLEESRENKEEDEILSLYSYDENSEGVQEINLDGGATETVEDLTNKEVNEVEGGENASEEVESTEQKNTLMRKVLVLGKALSTAAVFAVVSCGGDKQAEKKIDITNKTPKEELDSTTIRREPNIENIEKYRGDLVPSGDFENGLINLCDSTEKAQAEGILRYFPNGHVFAIEGMKNPREQGISIRALAFYKLHKGLSPRPLMTGASFKNYTKEQKGDLRTFNVEKFKEDLRKAVPKADFTKNGKFDSEKYNEVVSVFIEANMETYKALLEWAKSNPQHRNELYEKETKPLEGRTGTINDSKGKNSK